MILWGVGLVYLIVFIAGWLGAKWAGSFAVNKTHTPVYVADFPFGFVSLALLLGYGAVFFSQLGLNSILFGSLIGCMAGLVLGCVQMNLSTIQRIPFLWGICFLSTFFFPELPLLSYDIIGVFYRAIFASIWVSMILSFVYLDRVPYMSMTLSMGWAIAYFLMASSFGIFPLALGYTAFSIVCFQIGANGYLKRQYWPALGQSAGTVMGFVWGGFAVYLLSKGYFGAVISLYAYPLMEILISLILTGIVYKRFALMYPFLIEQALGKNIQGNKLLRRVLLWHMVLCLLGAFSIQHTLFQKYVAIGLLIMLLHTYIRLADWGVPRPRFRDLWADAKMGIKQVKCEVNTLSETLKQHKKKSDVSAQTGKTSPVAKKKHPTSPKRAGKGQK